MRRLCKKKYFGGRLFAICFVGGVVSPLRALINMEQIVLGPAEEAADVGALVIKTELGDGIESLDCLLLFFLSCFSNTLTL